jgi:hypothetical protein
MMELFQGNHLTCNPLLLENSPVLGCSCSSLLYAEEMCHGMERNVSSLAQKGLRIITDWL